MPMADERKWVVYLAKMNHTPPGIYKRHVTLVNPPGIAFVHPRGESARADMVSPECVFDDEEAAKEYFAAGGVRKWVVLPGYENEPATMFEAFVRYGAHQKYGGRHTFKAFKRCDGQPTGDMWGADVCENKREARSLLRSIHRDQLKKARENIKKAQAMIAALQKAKA